MSGYNYGVIEVTQGEDGANATPRSQVADMISAALPSAQVYGGAQSRNGPDVLTVPEGSWTDLATLPNRFVSLPSSEITNTNAALTYGSTTSHDMAVTLVVTLSQDQPTANILLTLFLNGSPIQRLSQDVLTEVAAESGIKYQLTLTTIVPLNYNDVLTPKLTLTGASGSVTRYAMQFYMIQAN